MTNRVVLPAILLMISSFLSCAKKEPLQLTIENSVGLASAIPPKGTDTVRIYNEDGTVWEEIMFLTHTDHPFKDFSPFAFKQEDFLLTFKVNRVLADRYEVWVNEKEKKYVPRNLSFTFFNWPDYILKGEHSVDVGLTTLYEDNTEKSKIITNYDADIFKPIEIDEDWLKIKWFDYKTKSSRTGWLRWRNGEKLLIQFTLAD